MESLFECENCNHPDPHETVFKGVDDWDEVCTHKGCRCKNYKQKSEMRMSIIEAAKLKAANKRKAEITAKKREAEHKSYVLQKEKEWINKVWEILKPLEGDIFTISTTKKFGVKTWLVKEACFESVILAVALVYNSYAFKGSDESPIERVCELAVQIFEDGEIPKPFEKRGKDYFLNQIRSGNIRPCFSTYHAGNFETDLSEKLAEMLAEYV